MLVFVGYTQPIPAHSSTFLRSGFVVYLLALTSELSSANDAYVNDDNTTNEKGTDIRLRRKDYLNIAVRITTVGNHLPDMETT
jgi:hypothetical protein